MLSSLTATTRSGGGGAGACRRYEYSDLHPAGPIFSSFPARQLLIRCADLVHRGDLLASDRAICLLLSAANAGADDAADRLVRQFCRALSLRIAGRPSSAVSSSAAYFLFNQITPFLRFAHLTANQAILEAVAGCRRIHILDLDTHHGLQWPPLLQAIATTGDCPPSVRITGAGSDFETLRRTGDRLSAFARSFRLDFDFRPLLLPKHRSHRPTLDQLQLEQAETVVVNCALFLHKLQKEEELLTFLTALKAINPTVVTIAEREMPPPSSDGSPSFIHQFAAALEYYSAMFNSLEATLPPSSRERSEVEQSCLGWEIQSLVAGRESHQWSERWEIAMRTVGFQSIPPSRFAVSQGEMLLRLHYPAEGYKMEVAKEGFCFLGWKNKPLFSVSSWHALNKYDHK